MYTSFSETLFGPVLQLLFLPFSEATVFRCWFISCFYSDFGLHNVCRRVCSRRWKCMCIIWVEIQVSHFENWSVSGCRGVWFLFWVFNCGNEAACWTVLLTDRLKSAHTPSLRPSQTPPPSSCAFHLIPVWIEVCLESHDRTTIENTIYDSSAQIVCVVWETVRSKWNRPKINADYS